MSNDPMAEASNLSLESLKRQMEEEEREKSDFMEAVALSLGKTVDQLTARDLLNATAEPKQSPKRRSSAIDVDTQPKKLAAVPRYWDGVVKLTHVDGFVGTSFIKFEDIVEKVCSDHFSFLWPSLIALD